MLIVIVLGYTWFTVFSSLKETRNFNMSTTTNGYMSDMVSTINVKSPDFYYLDINSKSEIGTTVMIESENFDTVYTVSGNNFYVENHRILLRKGIYTIRIIYDNNNLSNQKKAIKLNCKLD